MKSEDIAKLAGVSRSTVSRVVNNYTNVPEETRLKVMAVIEQYNYHPNTSARALAGKKSETIGVFFVIDRMSGEVKRIYHDDFFSTYLNAIVDIANNCGYYVLVQTIYTDDDYSKVSKAFIEKRIDGGILIGTRKDTLKKIQLESIQEEMVVFDYDPEQLKKMKLKNNCISILNSDDGAGIAEAVKSLVEKGHERIGFIKGVEGTLSARTRYDAYRNALISHKLVLKDEYILEGEFNQETAYLAMKECIKSGEIATAYICGNDYMAIAAMDCLVEHGYKIPMDVSFIGFDNTMTGQLMTPKLTTLAPDFYQMAKKAVDIIWQRNQGQDNRNANVLTYKVELIERESVREIYHRYDIYT